MLMPYMEQNAVYNAMNFNMVMRGNGIGEKTNTTATTTQINNLLCPSSGSTQGSWYGKPWPGNAYFASTGASISWYGSDPGLGNYTNIPNGPFMVGGKAIGIRDVMDGTSNSVAFGEWRIGDFNDSKNSIQDIAGQPVGAFGSIDRNMAVATASFPLGGGALAAVLNSCQQCLQTNSCPSHTGSNGGGSQFSFNGRLWAEGTYCHGLGNLVVPPNSPYPYCQFEDGDSDTDSGTIAGLTSFHAGGANVCMVDGSVRFLKSSIAYNTLWSIGSINQGEVVSADAY